MKLNVDKIREDFPVLTTKVNDKPLIYLDSAATTLKPNPVVDRIEKFYRMQASNVHRGAHHLSDQATTYFESARQTVAHFLNAKETAEIIFTTGTTGSINLVANSFGTLLKEGDEIVITEMEHHANFVPWQMIAGQKNLKLKMIPVLDNGELDYECLSDLVTSKTKLVALTYCSNTLGTINDVKRVVQTAHKVGARVLVDGAQIVSNHKVDMQNLDCDFFVFSAHKLFGPYGIGVLYGKREVLEKMPPYQGGGSMIKEVTFEKTTYNELPYKFEAGTPHIEGVIGMASGIEYIEKLGLDNVAAYEDSLLKYATQKLKQIPGLRIIGEAPHKASIISIVIDGIHHSDLGQLLNEQGIAIRAGHHCTQPLMKRFGITGTARISLSIYNTTEEIDRLVVALLKAKELLS